MFIHNFRYSFKILLKNKQLVFWTLAFPLIMAMLFNMAFSNIENSNQLEPIEIAVVNDSNFSKNTIYKESLKSLGEGEDRIFNIQYVDLSEAEKLLADNAITGYVSFDSENVRTTVNSNGINETILCYIIDEIKCDTSVIMNLGAEKIRQEIMSGNTNIDYAKIYTDIAQSVVNTDVALKDTSPTHLSFVMIEYYSLIAMTCLYGGLLSMLLVNYRLANMSAVGKRSGVSPAKKGSMIFSSLSAAFLVQMFGLVLLYLLMIFIIGVDFGNNLPMIILISLLGETAGLSLGVAVSVLVRGGENTKTMALIGIVMAGCFLSGMMGITMKNLIDKNIPFLNRINPVAMITDGLYALYYYDSMDRFYFDAVSLVIFSAVVLLISWRGLRRQRYDSI